MKPPSTTVGLQASEAQFQHEKNLGPERTSNANIK